MALGAAGLDLGVHSRGQEAKHVVCRLTFGDARAKHGKQIGRWPLDFSIGP